MSVITESRSMNNEMDRSIVAELKKRGDMPLAMFRDFVGEVSDLEPHGDMQVVNSDWNCLLCTGVSGEFIQLMQRLTDNDLIEAKRMMESEAIFVHGYHGTEMYDMPVANEIPKNGYKKRRFAPTLIRAVTTPALRYSNTGASGA